MTIPIQETRLDIINRLADLRTSNIWVRGLPDQQGQFGARSLGIVTVYKLRDDFDVPSSAGTYRQNRQMRWVFDIALQNFVGQSGAETITEAIAHRIIGFQPRHCKKMYVTRIEYIPGKDNADRWVHEIEAIAPSLLVEPEDTSESNAPTLTQIITEMVNVNGGDLDPVVSRATNDDESRYPQ